MSLVSNFESIRGQLEDTLEASQYLKDDSVAQVLDDILLRQKFWAEDVGFENDPYSVVSKEPSDAIETMRHLAAMRTLLVDIKMAIDSSPMSPNKTNDLVEKAHELQHVNNQLCNSDEIFNILEGLEGLETEFNDQEKAPETSPLPDKTQASGSIRHSLVPIEKVTRTGEENVYFDPTTPMMNELPSYLSSTSRLQSMQPPEARVSLIVEKALSLIRIVLELKKIPKDLQSSFEMEQCRLEFSLDAMILHAKASEGLKEVNYWKPFEDNFLAIILRLEELRDILVKSILAGKNPWLPIGKATLDFLHGILESLRHGNDCLEALSVALQQGSSPGSFRAHFPTRSAKKFKRITKMQKATVLLGHVDIQRMSQAIQIINYVEVEQHLPHSAQHSKPDLLIKKTKFGFPETKSRRHETNFITEYSGNYIIISCTYNDLSRFSSKSPPRRQTERLARLLNFDLESMGLSVLRFVGYVEIGFDSLGYGFRLPQGVSHKVNPTTLKGLLQQDSSLATFNPPDLGEKFNLAKALVNTIFKMHTIDWAHGKLIPGNVLFWPFEYDAQTYEYEKPYLVGFDVAGGIVSEESFVGREKPSRNNYSGHRSDKHIKGRQFARDCYSLGILLLEIGSWSLSTSHSYVVGEGDFPKFKYLRESLQYEAKTLQRNMGSRYVEATVACFDASLEDLWEESEDSAEQYENYLKYFGSKIVNVIALCNA